ncbi:MAG: biotin transporter BioY [Dialister invisus]
MRVLLFTFSGAAGVPFFHDAFRCFRYSGTAGGFIIGFAVMAFVTGLISRNMDIVLKQC